MASPLERSLAVAHRFDFAPAFRVAGIPFGIHPGNCQVELLGTHLVASFGPWSVTTPLTNIEAAEVTGPYGWPKVIGPPHLSRVDFGLTFASNPTAGACLRFREPVTGIEPFGWIRHPGLTVTVADPERLVADITGSTTHIGDLARDERAVLEGRTAAELRSAARDLGIVKTSSMKKSELVDRILSDEDLTRAALERDLATGSGSN